MTDTMYQLLAVIIYFLGMIGIGFYAYRRIFNLNDYIRGKKSRSRSFSTERRGG